MRWRRIYSSQGQYSSTLKVSKVVSRAVCSGKRSVVVQSLRCFAAVNDAEGFGENPNTSTRLKCLNQKVVGCYSSTGNLDNNLSIIVHPVGSNRYCGSDCPARRRTQYWIRFVCAIHLKSWIVVFSDGLNCVRNREAVTQECKVAAGVPHRIRGVVQPVDAK